MTKTSAAPTSWDDADFFNPERINGLIEAARAAAEHAYAPYSKFRVGAVVLTAEGELVVGCNVENASFGLTCCAERTAIFSAIAQGCTELVAIAVSCPDAEPFRSSTRMPCGACRQVIVELLSPGAAIFIDQGGWFSVDDLLPEAFFLS